MSVITSLLATPNRLEMFWLYLLSESPKAFSREELEHVFSPPSLVGRGAKKDEGKAGGNIFNAVFKEVQSLGLVGKPAEESEGKFAAQIPPHGMTELKIAKHWLEKHLRQTLTTPSLAAKVAQQDVPLVLAWFSLQSSTHPLIFGMTQGVEIKSAFPNNESLFGLNTNARLEQCYYWARYLGLSTVSARQVRKDGKYSTACLIIPDPTEAIRSLLPSIFDGGRELTASEFLDRLGQLCPVLERGEARKAVISQSAHPEDFPSDDELSQGTSLALLRLKAEKTLELDNRSDALAPCLINLGSNQELFSHVRWIRKQ